MIIIQKSSLPPSLPTFLGSIEFLLQGCWICLCDLLSLLWGRLYFPSPWLWHQSHDQLWATLPNFRVLVDGIQAETWNRAMHSQAAFWSLEGNETLREQNHCKPAALFATAWCGNSLNVHQQMNGYKSVYYRCMYGVGRRRQWHPTPVPLPGKPLDGGPWKAAVHGVAEGQTQLSDFTFTFTFTFMHWRTHSSVLAWRIPGTGEPGGLPSMESHRVRHDWSDLAAGTVQNSFISFNSFLWTL